MFRLIHSGLRISAPCRRCLEQACRISTQSKAGTCTSATSPLTVLLTARPHVLPSQLPVRSYSMLQSCRRSPSLLHMASVRVDSRRGFGVARLVGRFLKIRYLLLTSAVGGGVTIHQTFESWKDKVSWMQEYFPDTEKWGEFGKELKRLTGNVSSLPEIHLPSKDWLGKMKVPGMDSVRQWLDELTEEDMSSFGENSQGKLPLGDLTVPDAGSSLAIGASTAPALGFSRSSGEKDKEAQNADKRHEEIMDIQARYQKEMERLEKENRELRKQIMLKDQKQGKRRRMKRSLIDMYSEVLDELSDYDSSYQTQDHLPRVVVVGDQSSGKTSVLEMIAQARIFPRGSGEMMTRSPVKVTLSEGPYHIATFKGSTREFDLTKESELEALRREVEIRMKRSVLKGQTVSSETIAMTVKGPGLQRMVLVDLPGVISTVTTGMADDTRDRIKRICRQAMENPNAIILCIQDGSLDAERSNVTDLVSTMDPQGKRTIFVLTKVDLAESNLLNPDRIKQILEGRLFPMKALGYFAVVTGKGNTNDTIQDIKDYEEQFFRASRLFRDGVLKPTQMTTLNLSMAVSECFWKMVRDSVEQQADAFKATRFNLETEWKNTFPKIRELDREELFEKARGEILDEIINLSQITPQQWEEAFSRNLWGKMSTYIFENIYLPAAQAENTGIFNTTVDIKLKQWADKQLPQRCVQVGWETLQDQFNFLLEQSKGKKDHDGLFDNLKTAVMEESLTKHEWDEKAEESLRVFQMNALEDRSVHDKGQWDQALHFMETSVKEKLKKAQEQLRELEGPTSQEQWLYWRYKSPEQKRHSAVIKELEKLLQSNAKHKPVLSYDELTTIRKNLEAQNIEVDSEFIRETFHPLYRKHFLKQSLALTGDCKKGFYYYQRGFADTGMDCSDVVLFWRIHRMLQVTSNALRQQVMNNEARRLEKNIKCLLDDIGDDSQRLQQLLMGKRVTLAEELKRVRQIQELLEEFIQALNKEKT